MIHINLEKLVDFLESRLSAAERKTVEAHLASGCKRCHSERLWLQRLYELAAADSVPDPPDWLVKQAVALFVNRPIAEKTGRWTWVAQLVFDSLARLEYQNIREIGEAGRHLVYRAEAFDIDLRFLPTEIPRRENVIGQVLGSRRDFSDVSGVPVNVYRGRKRITSTTTNEVGVFNLFQLPQGSYDLKIRLLDRTIHLMGAKTSDRST